MMHLMWKTIARETSTSHSIQETMHFYEGEMSFGWKLVCSIQKKRGRKMRGFGSIEKATYLLRPEMRSTRHSVLNSEDNARLVIENGPQIRALGSIEEMAH
jgi:hypothetical protein